MADPGEFKRRLPAMIGTALIVLALAVGIWFVYKALTTKNSKSTRTVQVIQVIRPPPPPPPPEEKPPPPPPPDKQEKFEQSAQEPTPSNEPEPAENLALDAAGSAGSDAFGFGSRPGGRDLVGGTGTAPFGAYQNRLATALHDKLSADPRLKGKKYDIYARVWIDHEGRVTQVKLENAPLDSSVEVAVRADVSAMQFEPPQIEMPVPVRVRLVQKS